MNKKIILLCSLTKTAVNDAVGQNFTWMTAGSIMTFLLLTFKISHIGRCMLLRFSKAGVTAWDLNSENYSSGIELKKLVFFWIVNFSQNLSIYK